MAIYSIAKEVYIDSKKKKNEPGWAIPSIDCYEIEKLQAKSMRELEAIKKLLEFKADYILGDLEKILIRQPEAVKVLENCFNIYNENKYKKVQLIRLIILRRLGRRLFILEVDYILKSLNMAFSNTEIANQEIKNILTCILSSINNQRYLEACNNEIGVRKKLPTWKKTFQK